MRFIAFMMHGPSSRYDVLITEGALDADPAQAAAIEKLQALHDALEKHRADRKGLFRRRPSPPPRGLYLWGGVGRGKTLLMDLFFNNTSVEPRRRLHFHEFMAEAHDRIGDWRVAETRKKRAHPAYDKASADDPIPYAAYDLAAEAQLLCFDEFQVTDIADAMILGRLFEGLFRNSVVVVATSNRTIDDLYKDGLNRQLFLPFIDMLKEKTESFRLDSGEDYRLKRLVGAPIYYSPLGADADAAMDAAWARVICGANERRDSFTVKGRTLTFERTARDAVRTDFKTLCAQPLAANDYLEMTRRYATIFIDQIPMMGPENRNEAKRFVTLIDAIYDSRTKLVCSADAEPDDLYPKGDGAFEFERTASRLMEMRSAEYLAAEHDPNEAAA
ncbi:MAG: cell division protein ZapE [Pseudomonadota bacterium]